MLGGRSEAQIKRRPAALEGAAGRQGKIPAATYSPTRKPCSTIGSGGLNFRVRDGNGWGPSDIATGNLIAPGAGDRGCGAMHTRKQKSECDGREWRPSSTLASGRVASVCSGSRRKNDQAARAISIGQLNALRRLHLRPIDVVVFDGPSGGLRPGRPRLEVRFPLRCFQRLSSPDTATQRCHWRDNWYTGGPSNPVLSY